MLHVTNGSSVSLGDSGLGGEILTWEDALHEGPVPAGLNDEDLGRLRGEYLDSLWAGESSAVDSLARRDRTLAQHTANGEVTLWFEHDLYDQLQLIQILDRLRRQTPKGKPSLICIDRYLGTLTGPQLASLWSQRHEIADPELELASAAWQAFRSPDPTAIEPILRQDTLALPYLAGALERHLQQFPSRQTGLARTERQILELVDAGHREFATLFSAAQKREERIFMGDEFFKRYLLGLCECRHPLLRQEDERYFVTPLGADVLAGRTDHVRLNGIDRWLGGVRLKGDEAAWRWDEEVPALACRRFGY